MYHINLNYNIYTNILSYNFWCIQRELSINTLGAYRNFTALSILGDQKFYGYNF